MRPVATPQSALRAPLNRLLGTEANVRILRVLAETATPLSRAEIARRAELNASGVRRSVDALIGWGIVESVGAGSRRPVRLRREHPLAAPLEDLFQAERRRFEELIDGLQSQIAELRPPPLSAWVQGPVARDEDEPEDPLVVGLLAAAGDIDETADRLRAAVGDLVRAQDVLIEVRAFALPDLRAARHGRSELENLILLHGPSPLDLLDAEREREGGAAVDHALLDRRALALGRALAERIAEDPSLVERARRYVRERLEDASPGERETLREWDGLLENASVPRLRQFLVDPGERATRLRQTLPFLEALSPDERQEIIEQVER